MPPKVDGCAKLPPKAVKVDGCARLQDIHNNTVLFLVNEYQRTNFDPMAEANLRAFMQENNPMPDEFLQQQGTLQEAKKQELLDRTLAILLSGAGKRSDEAPSPFLMQIVLLCEQFQKKEMVSPKILAQLSTESSLPENMQDGFIQNMLDKMSHYMSEWRRLAHVRLHLEEKRKEHEDIGLFCQMVLAAEECRKNVIVILADTTRTADDKLTRIHHECNSFHTSFPQPRALSIFQHSVACYIPSKADVTVILDAIDRLGIRTVIDVFCGRALLVAILRMYTKIPIIGCDVKLHNPFVTEGIRQYDAHEFAQKYFKTAKPDEKILFTMIWPPSEDHLDEGKVDKRDFAPQDRILSCPDPRIAGVAVVSDKTDYNILLCGRGTVIGSERSEDLLSNPDKYCQLHTSQVPPMNRGGFQPCAPVRTCLTIYGKLHEK